ncbi:MAG: alpha-glucuronidase [Acidobacteriota bacterium]|nr:MAG: alpha-glucuronidase [Acidobacteriota bacterium]
MKKSQTFKVLLCLFPALLLTAPLFAEDGYRLWLRYDLVDDPARLEEYRSVIREAIVLGETDTLDAVRAELAVALPGLLGQSVPFVQDVVQNGTLLIGKRDTLFGISERDTLFGEVPGIEQALSGLGEEGFLIRPVTVRGTECVIVTGNSDRGGLYGVFHLLRLLQAQQPFKGITISSRPRIQRRVLNHWDNLDRTVERGYAGFSLWDWHKLPDYIDPRYRDYARANASIGINGASVNNVNANPLSLTREYLIKSAALANVFRPYGIRLYMSIKFSAPMTIGGLETADPLDPGVRHWWKKKAEEIYGVIPDFGGFLVKANSEGQPGPQDYNRSHAEGANMLAEALAPHGGVVMWRAFVYDNNVPVDRAKQAYNEFTPLDGSFLDNVLIQVKNGPIDFQPREPFHPLFGAMPQTPLMMEFQITQEYLGFATHLVYLGTLFKECLESDTFAKGPGSTVAGVVDGSLENHRLSGMAGVSNIGTDRNWTGHPFAQANWFAYGRLAWDNSLGAEEIAEEWLRMTFSNDVSFIQPVQTMMLGSREAAVNYMTPLGLHHLMARGHHYGPGPWVSGGRADWTSVYYHRADEEGIGFDRTASGSDALEQYAPEVRAQFADPRTISPEHLLWFHHVDWDFAMQSGRTLWEELCYRYNLGVKQVQQMQKTWEAVAGLVDGERFQQVKSLLRIQEKEARWWRDACLLYFQTFSKREIPAEYGPVKVKLEDLMKIEHPFAPGH